MNTKIALHIRRKRRVGAKIANSGREYRLNVFRSNAHIYGQISDLSGSVLMSVSDLKPAKKMTKTEAAFVVGEELAKKAIAKKIKSVVFDRSGYNYHGRIKAVAEGARKGGLEF